MEKLLFTSESVTEGHPDKLCDAVSDAILDACIQQDPMSRVACETASCTGFILVTGEITTKAQRSEGDVVWVVGERDDVYRLLGKKEKEHLRSDMMTERRDSTETHVQ